MTQITIDNEIISTELIEGEFIQVPFDGSKSGITTDSSIGSKTLWDAYYEEGIISFRDGGAYDFKNMTTLSGAPGGREPSISDQGFVYTLSTSGDSFNSPPDTITIHYRDLINDGPGSSFTIDATADLSFSSDDVGEDATNAITYLDGSNDVGFLYDVEDSSGNYDSYYAKYDNSGNQIFDTHITNGFLNSRTLTPARNENSIFYDGHSGGEHTRVTGPGQFGDVENSTHDDGYGEPLDFVGSWNDTSGLIINLTDSNVGEQVPVTNNSSPEFSYNWAPVGSTEFFDFTSVVPFDGIIDILNGDNLSESDPEINRTKFNGVPRETMRGNPLKNELYSIGGGVPKKVTDIGAFFSASETKYIIEASVSSVSINGISVDPNTVSGQVVSSGDTIAGDGHITLKKIS